MTITRTNIHQASLIRLSSLLSGALGFILVANIMLQGKKIKEADIFSNINMSPFPLKRRVRNGTCSLQDIWKLFKYFIFFLSLWMVSVCLSIFFPLMEDDEVWTFLFCGTRAPGGNSFFKAVMLATIQPKREETGGLYEGVWDARNQLWLRNGQEPVWNSAISWPMCNLARQLGRGDFKPFKSGWNILDKLQSH